MPQSDPNKAALLDPKLLLLFEALYQTGSVSRSAERLGQGQPTVSIWLGKLRRELNDQLFVRTPAGMKPTPRAEALISTVREALDALRRLSASELGFAPATADRRFRLCMTDASLLTLLPQISDCVLRATRVQLDVTLPGDDAARLLHSGGADLALGLIPQLGTGFYQKELFSNEWSCLIRESHPRIRENI